MLNKKTYAFFLFCCIFFSIKNTYAVERIKFERLKVRCGKESNNFVENEKKRYMLTTVAMLHDDNGILNSYSRQNVEKDKFLIQAYCTKGEQIVTDDINMNYSQNDAVMPHLACLKGQGLRVIFKERGINQYACNAKDIYLGNVMIIKDGGNGEISESSRVSSHESSLDSVIQNESELGLKNNLIIASAPGLPLQPKKPKIPETYIKVAEKINEAQTYAENFLAQERLQAEQARIQREVEQARIQREVEARLAADKEAAIQSEAEENRTKFQESAIVYTTGNSEKTKLINKPKEDKDDKKNKNCC